MSRDLDLHAFAEHALTAPAAEAFDAEPSEAASIRPARPSLLPRPSLTPRPARRRPSSRQRTERQARRADAVQLPKPAPLPQIDAPMDELLMQQLLTEYTPVVRQIVGGFQRKLPRNVLREDLIGAGMSGLWDAIRRQGDKRGESFEWYVRVRIRGAILDELRAQDWLPRRARLHSDDPNKAAVPSVVRFDEITDWEQNASVASTEASSSEAALDAKFTREALARAIEQLPERERHIVAAHYFLGTKFKDLGIELGVSEPRVSQLHSRAMQRLKVLMSDSDVG